MDDLKPCPFCGQEVTLVQFAPVFRYDIWAIVHEEKEPICFLWHSNGYEGKKKMSKNYGTNELIKGQLCKRRVL